MIIEPYKILNDEWKSLKERTEEKSNDLNSLDKIVLKLARPLAPVLHNLPKKVAIAYMITFIGLFGREFTGGIYKKIHESRSNKLTELVEFYDGKEGVSEEDSSRYSEAYERLPAEIKDSWFNNGLSTGGGEVARNKVAFLGYDEIKHLLKDYEQDQRE